MSQRIKVRPDQLRQGAQQLRQASSKLQELGSRVAAAYNCMDAETRSAAALGGKVRNAQARATALAQEALRLASYLEAKGNGFEQADRAGHAGLHRTGVAFRGVLDGNLGRGPMSVPNVANNQLVLGALASTGAVATSVRTLLDWCIVNSASRSLLLEQFQMLIESFWTIKELRSMKGLDFVKGSAYVDQVIVKGSRQAKEAGFIKSHVSHIKTVKGFNDVVSHGLASQLFGGVKTVTRGAAILTAVFTVVDKYFDNCATYKDDKQVWQKTVVATTIDTAVKTSVVAGGTALGAAAGGALLGGALGAATGGLLAPIGVSLGTHLGGMIGGMAGGWVADKIMRSAFYQDHKEQWVQAGADAIDKGATVAKDRAQGLAEAASRIGNALQSSAQEPARKFDNAVSVATGGLLRLFVT